MRSPSVRLGALVVTPPLSYPPTLLPSYLLPSYPPTSYPLVPSVLSQWVDSEKVFSSEWKLFFCVYLHRAALLLRIESHSRPYMDLRSTCSRTADITILTHIP